MSELADSALTRDDALIAAEAFAEAIKVQCDPNKVTRMFSVLQKIDHASLTPPPAPRPDAVTITDAMVERATRVLYDTITRDYEDIMPPDYVRRLTRAALAAAHDREAGVK